VKALLQLTILAPSTEKSLYVSDDGHLAVMRFGTSLLEVLSDEDAGLRETLYHLEAKNVEAEETRE
jgi:hypothetical protein